jgi:hypothetical protein
MAQYEVEENISARKRQTEAGENRHAAQLPTHIKEAKDESSAIIAKKTSIPTGNIYAIRNISLLWYKVQIWALGEGKDGPVAIHTMT